MQRDAPFDELAEIAGHRTNKPILFRFLKSVLTLVFEKDAQEDNIKNAQAFAFALKIIIQEEDLSPRSLRDYMCDIDHIMKVVRRNCDASHFSKEQISTMQSYDDLYQVINNHLPKK
jgi:hypothetical protein